jgi:hypothetical protein
MSQDPYVRNDGDQTAAAKFCPMINQPCKQEACQWWVHDFMEAQKTMRVDCAVAMIAKALTDESLLALKR